MASKTLIKAGVVSAFALSLIALGAAGAFTTVHGDPVDEGVSASEAPPAAAPTPGGDYVGSEACQACHEDQFKNFSSTKHAKLADVHSWKGKVVGCEQCHGPGKAHLEDATDPTKIISFKGKNSKQISETCLACHAGKESHDNFRRGEHWRNDVGCTDCHSPHGAPLGDSKADSVTLVAATSHQNAGMASIAMLKQSEPQLCISCHSETKSQFSKPFHHKVLEGTMKCSDCHNPHGGFETKQTRLGFGADVTCIKCHADKQGPFVYEHAPLKTEGCVACHSPHGSANAKLLNRSTVRQLCIECHSVITEQLAPGVPSFHNQATVRYRDCTVCHSAIHGSNSNNRFFR